MHLAVHSVFYTNWKLLLDNDLVKGGDINNAIVVVDKPVTDDEMARLAKAFKREKIEVKSEGYLNNLELRFPNEPARHKLLDVIGDLALVGYPIKSRIIANRPGHSTNVEFAKKIKQYIKKNKHVPKMYQFMTLTIATCVYTQQQIEKTTASSSIFYLVDKVVELSDKHIIGIKNVTFNEWFISRVIFPATQ